MSSNSSAISEHPRVRALLAGAVDDPATAAHAYLFHGPLGSGRVAAAQVLASALLSDGEVADSEVALRVSRDTHPDLVWVKPSGAHGLLRSDIDTAVVSAVTATPFLAQRRVFVIEGADTMNDEAANRLLKTLEEPPSYAHLILLAEQLERVLPTIRSRCQAVPFPPADLASITRRLVAVGHDQASAQAAAQLSLGSQREAIYLTGELGVAQREAAQAFARAALAGQSGPATWQPIVALSKRVADAAEAQTEEGFSLLRESLPTKEKRKFDSEVSERAHRMARRARTESIERMLRLAGFWFRDIGCIKLGSAELIYHTDCIDQLTEDSSNVEVSAVTAAVECLERVRSSLGLNVGLELAFEALALDLNALFEARPVAAKATGL